MKTYQNTIENFLTDLASSSPAPGGGAVAALSGALAASLSSMVINLTVNKKKFMEYSDDIKEKFNQYLGKCEELRREFLEYIDKDIEAFNLVMQAYKMPKDTDEQKAERNKAIQNALIEAYKVPYSVAESAYNMFEIVDFIAEYGNQNAITDAGVAAIQILAAIEAAVLNVRINLGGINDVDLVSDVDMNCKRLLIEAGYKKEEVLKKVYRKI
ncbi:cyclodeaminase/cyclohydrolase family protein [Thermobrachium celere]|uniref:cyclodeaminase/cyclohydrolase family protein n=1 Tax=Thermobrachium celere TaxID=53422 RepID=UPI001942CBDA|nr:cyclodeaminase/cyclohydrolase family protein [Thermobrachium celere]GFR36106.1 formiminotransferase-cyclodeaminase [Thermobrachium celere]